MAEATGFKDGLSRGGGSGELRQSNLTAILRFLRDHGASSRHDTARGCGLGVSTMTDLVGDLRARRLVAELDPIRRPGAGRPTRPIALDGEPWCVMGVHVEVERVHVRGATVGGTDLWQETAEAVFAEHHDGAAVLADVIVAQLPNVPEGQQLVAVEIAVPGYVATDGQSVSSRALGWDGVGVGKAVRSALADAGLPDVSVGLSSDFHLAGLFAARSLLSDASSTVAAYFGGVSEVGSALVVNGEIFRGAGGGAGDLAHLHVQLDGTRCWCGRHGCLNSVIRVQELLVQAGLHDEEAAAELVVTDPDAALSLLVDAANAGDTRVVEALEKAGSALGRAVDDVVGSVNPHAVVLGGYLGRLAPFLLPALDRQLRARVHEGPYADTRILVTDEAEPPVAAGAVLAARDACLYDPLGLTTPLR
ncbi:Sugar kinase of the NBD/HSP70 family, may contain an N-terminal HTH domain [Microlunatus sagamiharensis]|uniref:Sugar kinase of the NBD/HSP70 family, may contain an N-terminal HTH domain n=2 Tax=Microlunatus sagamiharensis TaxID=546874 RepID=A0A1H2NFQ5_9ACTN|nr:Sugar kinase of the NBD/HSP70 family, may contain an N-terminal HTH domain [Microlunatus sagamiharensis]